MDDKEKACKKNSVPISIIVPVYNVSEWLDECVESIVNQSFCDFELLLIDDGSTDDSGEKCDYWEERDERIKVIHKDNEGPSIARNIGVDTAQGEFLSFVDADDWVEPEFLMKLYLAVTNEKADIAECGVCRVDSRTGQRTFRTNLGNLGQPYSLDEHMKYGYTLVTKCLIRKNLFYRYHLKFPNCHSEGKAIYPLLLALSDKTINVKECLYNYRLFRKNSLTSKPRINGGDEIAIGLQAFEALQRGFRDNGIFNKYRDVLQELIIYKLSDMLAVAFLRREKAEYEQLLDNYRGYIASHFPNIRLFPYMTLGGYNLNRILWEMRTLHDASSRFNFSSLISIMGSVQEQAQFVHKNKYREIMIQRDIYSAFWEIMAEKKPQYIIIDFMEERFDILEYQGGYITLSDAYQESVSCIDEKDVIKREDCNELWEKSCEKFICKMNDDYPECKIVLVKNYLCEQVGDLREKKFFAQLDKIRHTNTILKRYYEYFEDKCKHAIVIETNNDPLYFTDNNYEYGAVPSHLNMLVNQKIARKIETAIDNAESKVNE